MSKSESRDRRNTQRLELMTSELDMTSAEMEGIEAKIENMSMERTVHVSYYLSFDPCLC